MNRKYYAVFIDGELWTNVVDNLDAANSYAKAGFMFLSEGKAKDIAESLQEHEDNQGKAVEVVEVGTFDAWKPE